MDPITFVILSLATYRLTRLVTTDDFPPVLKAREWILNRWPSDDTEWRESAIEEVKVEIVELPRHPDIPASRWERTWIPMEPHWLGKLITCAWCASMWIGGLVVALHFLVPAFWYLSYVLAFSAVTGWITSKV